MHLMASLNALLQRPHLLILPARQGALIQSGNAPLCDQLLAVDKDIAGQSWTRQKDRCGVPISGGIDIAHVPDHHIRALTGCQAAAIRTAQNLRPAQSRNFQCLSRLHCPSPKGQSLQQERLARFGHQIAGIVGGRSINPKPHRHTRVSHRAHRRNA